jgi:DNA-binding transcriptional ArsR family regulator
MGADDVMDTVSGTNGLNGGADATWILSRARGEADATLFVTGRDIEEQKLALRFDPAMATWTVIGDAQEYAQSEERRQVLEALPLASAMKTSEIAAAIGKKVQATDYLLKQLEGDGLVKKPKYGYWTRTGVESTVTPVTVTSNISKVQGIQAVKDLQGIQYLQGVIQEATPKPAQEPPSLDYGIDNEPSGASGESPEYCEVSIDETF